MMNNKYEYLIVGNYEVNGHIELCLIAPVGREPERAEEMLVKIIANPPERCLGNIHIEVEEIKNCWWNNY